MTVDRELMARAVQAAVSVETRFRVPPDTSGATLTPRDLVKIATTVMDSGQDIGSIGELASVMVSVAGSLGPVSSGDVNLIGKYAGLLFEIFFIRNRPTVATAAVWTSGNEHQGRAIRDALSRLVVEYGLELVEYASEQHGSWWQRLKLTTRKLLSRPEVKERLAEIELGLKAALVDRQVSENDERKANALKAIAESFQGVDQAVVVIGQIVVVKSDGMLVAKSIDAQRAAQIEKSSVLLSDPRAVLNFISEHASLESDDEPQRIPAIAPVQNDPQ